MAWRVRAALVVVVWPCLCSIGGALFTGARGQRDWWRREWGWGSEGVEYEGRQLVVTRAGRKEGDIYGEKEIFTWCLV